MSRQLPTDEQLAVEQYRNSRADLIADLQLMALLQNTAPAVEARDSSLQFSTTRTLVMGRIMKSKGAYEAAADKLFQKFHGA